jgi:hypothetical protein
VHTENGKNNEIERTVFELNFGFYKIKREKKKKFVETRGFEPQSAGWEFRVLTTTPSGNLQDQTQNLRMIQSSSIFH